MSKTCSVAGTPFEVRSMDKILRYESTVSRQLEKAIDQLERLQEAREAESNQFEPSDLESDDAISNTDEATEEGSEAPEDPIPEEPQDVSDSSIPPDAPLTTAPQCRNQRQARVGSYGRASRRINQQKPPQIIRRHPRIAMLACKRSTKVFEQAMGPTPAEEHKNSLGSRENYETDPTDSNRFVETEEDAEFVQWVKYGKDLDLLE